MADDSTDDDRLYRGRERNVLAAALKASGMSARQAAAKMDMSDTRLRQIINGYQPMGRGRQVAVIAPADTLARIAITLNISADELEKAERLDAANELRARLRELASWGDDSASVIDAIRDWAEDPANGIAPDDALRFFDDSALLGELQRRLDRLRELARGEDGHGNWDASSTSNVINIEGGDGNADDTAGGPPSMTTQIAALEGDEEPGAEEPGEA